MGMTRAQIKGQINQLNRELNSVKNTYIQYQNLKSRVTQIINLLNNSLNKLNDSKNYLKKGYGNNTKTTPFKNTTNDINKITSKNNDCKIIRSADSIVNNEHQIFDLGYAKVEAVEAGYNKYHDVKECVGYIITLSRIMRFKV